MSWEDINVTVLEASKLGDSEKSNEELQREGEGSSSDIEISMESDPFAKALGYSPRSAKEQRPWADRERKRMTALTIDLTKKLGLDVEILQDNTGLNGASARAKFWG